MENLLTLVSGFLMFFGFLVLIWAMVIFNKYSYELSSIVSIGSFILFFMAAVFANSNGVNYLTFISGMLFFGVIAIVLFFIALFNLPKVSYSSMELFKK